MTLYIIYVVILLLVACTYIVHCTYMYVIYDVMYSCLRP
jgi:hypothetical protein